LKLLRKRKKRWKGKEERGSNANIEIVNMKMSWIVEYLSELALICLCFVFEDGMCSWDEKERFR
jgi:hypothetical protein